MRTARGGRCPRLLRWCHTPGHDPYRNCHPFTPPTPPAGGLGALSEAEMRQDAVSGMRRVFEHDGAQLGHVIADLRYDRDSLRAGIEVEAARPASSELVGLLRRVLTTTDSHFHEESDGKFNTMREMNAAIRAALAAQPPAPASVVEWTVVPGEDDDCGVCGRAKLRMVAPEYEPGGLLCDECGWNSSDTHPRGAHEHVPGLCGMSCGNEPAASGDREP